MNGEATAPAGYPWFQRLLTPARTCAVVATLLAATGIVVEFRREAAWSAANSSHPAPHAIAPAQSLSAARLRRPRYRHSVIVGGAFSRDEVEGIAREDAVVAAHYRGVDLDRLRTTKVRQPRDAYVSYRIGHRVYWTREPVRLAVGETLLTDGTNEIRARCGNRISDIPQAPVSDLEPIAEELDEQQDPRGDSSMTGERAPLASAPGAMAYVPFLSLIQQPLAGDGLNGPSDAAIWVAPPALVILGMPDPYSSATVWGEPQVATGGPTGRGATDRPIFGGRSGGGSSGTGGSTGGPGGGAGSGDGGPTDGDSTGPGSTGGSSQGGSSEGSTPGGGSAGPGSSGGSGGGGSSNGEGPGAGGSTGDSGSGGGSGSGGSAPGGSGGGSGTGGDFGSGGGGGGQLPTIYQGSEGVIVTTGDAPAVPEPGILAMLGLGVAATVTRWARRPKETFRTK